MTNELTPFSICCTTCQARLQVRDPSVVGQILTCPKCGSMVLVTAPTDNPTDVSEPETADAAPKPPARQPPTPPRRPSSLAADAVDETLADTVDDLALQAGMDDADDDGQAPVEPSGDSSAWSRDNAAAAILPTDEWTTSADARRWRTWLMLGGAAVTGVVLAILLFGYVASILTDDSTASSAASAPPVEPLVPSADTEPIANTEQSPSAAADELPSGNDASRTALDAVPPEAVADNADSAAATTEAAADPASQPEVAAAVEVPDSAEVTGEPPESATDLAEPTAEPPGLTAEPAADRMTPSGSLSQMLREFQALLEEPTAETFVDPAESPMEEIGGEDLGVEEGEAEAPEWSRPGPREIDLKARLADPVQKVQFDGVPLIEFTRFLTAFSTIPINVHPESLIWLHLSPNRPLDVDLEATTFAEMLTTTLQPLGLGWEINDQQIRISRLTTNPDAIRRVKFDVADLAKTADETRQLANLIAKLVAPETWSSSDGPGQIVAEKGSLNLQHREEILFEVLFLCEKLRVARGLSPRSRYDNRFFQTVTRRQRAATALQKPITTTFIRPTSLPRVLQTIEQAGGVRLLIDWQRLAEEGWSPDAEVPFSCLNTPLADALKMLLEPMNLAFRVVDDALFEVTTQQGLEEFAELEAYPAEAWIGPGETANEALKRIQSGLAIDARFAIDPVSQALLVVADQLSHQSLVESIAAAE